MLRYLRRLADFDIALDRSMIPLGSCTMKLNAAAEMEPITWPQFADLHPFAPPEQALGYARLIADLRPGWPRSPGTRRCRCSRTPAPRASWPGCWPSAPTTPPAATQERDVCLIPESAHGTNAASAVLAGLRVVVVKCGNDGAIDLADLPAKLAAHAGQVAAIMLTYPSTHGVFEETVTEVCDRGARRGRPGLRGRRQPQRAGGAGPAGPVRRRRVPPQPAQDVLHPARRRRARRGPGRGRCPPRPVPARQHRARREARHAETGGGGPVAAAPYGCAGILPISWAYIAMMGARRPAPGDPGGHPGRQLRRPAAGAALPGALHRPGRPGRPRVHHRPAADHQGDRGHRRRRGQAAHRLRLPRADHVVPGGRDADDRADRERGPGRAGPVLRGDDRDPAGDRAGRRR